MHYAKSVLPKIVNNGINLEVIEPSCIRRLWEGFRRS